MATLLKLIREDLRRRKKSAAVLKLEDTVKDIEEQPGKFAAASSLTDQRTWLHFAAQQGAARAVRLLLQHGAEANARDLLERTPLHHACFTKRESAEEVVELLLKGGAGPNALDCMGYSPLHMACMRENVGAIRSLAASKADFNAAGPSGFAPLHILCQSDTSLECIDVALANGANMHVYDECNRSPVDVARERGAYKAMRKLHEAHREWGEVQYLFKDEATSVGQEVARRKLDLRTSVAQMMQAVVTGKAPAGGDWTAPRPDDSTEKPKLTKRQQARLKAGKSVPGLPGYGMKGERPRVRGKHLGGGGTLFDAAEDAKEISAQAVHVSDDEDEGEGSASQGYRRRRGGADPYGDTRPAASRSGYGSGAGAGVGAGATEAARSAYGEEGGESAWGYGEGGGEASLYHG